MGCTPACSLDWPPTVGWQTEGMVARKLTHPKPHLRSGLDLSICTYNCRSLSKDELIEHLLQEIKKTSCYISRCVRNTLKR